MGLYPDLDRPITEVGGQYEAIPFNYSIRVFGGGWQLGTEVRYDRRFPLPQDPPTNEEWQVGFIQNVLSENCTCRYASGSTVPVIHRTPILDAERPGTQAWMYQYAITRPTGESVSIHPWAPINFGAGQVSLVGNSGMTSIRLSTRDYPKSQYFNFFRGVYNGDQLREVRHTIQFRAWLAAKRATARADDPRSYSLIALTNAFTLSYELDVPGLIPAFAAASRGAPAAGRPGSMIAEPGARCAVSELSWAQARPNSPRPIVSGATANDTLGQRHNQQGVGPLTLWGE